MFDVIWTDPNRELVGQRIIRKEKELERKEKDKDKRKHDGSHQSVSTSSSYSNSKRLSLLQAAKNKLKGSKSSLRSRPGTSNGAEENNELKANRTSSYSVDAALTNLQESDSSQRPVKSPFSSAPLPESCNIYSASHRDSLLSRWAQQAAVATGAFDRITASENAVSPSTPTTTSETLVQTLDSESYVTQTKEVTVSLRTPEIDIGQFQTQVHISSDGVKTKGSVLPDLAEDVNPSATEDVEPTLPAYLSPQTPPPIEHRITPILSPASYQGNHNRLGNADAWKPPHEWDCSPTRASGAVTVAEALHMSPASPSPDNNLFPSLAAVQRDIRMMMAASPELMLANMKSDLGSSSDAMVYKEHEMVKKRWMFSGLRKHSGYAERIERVNAHGHLDSPSGPRQPKILALYESPASASYLAALHPNVPINHLSPNPISPILFPNIQPLCVPVVSAAAASRALAPRLYSTVTCLNMPALFPSTDIPPFLGHINRCLIPGGALHLTIIDPQPVSTSMGPKLRSWLFNKLLVNLEKSFRTTMPSETVPVWLQFAQLRGRGSTISTAAVPAVPLRSEAANVGSELRCLTIRMLWQEVWGPFVHATKWWWEEDEIVEECVESGTHWQYSHIIAAKGEKD
ncbi:hypothetical protein GGR57DRAFT_500957 [Xylariaceae sp. FL1272]|nr:hypothetical protein GGR57DRAFT_500957 [Xylariaceae sp. FL1272]